MNSPCFFAASLAAFLLAGGDAFGQVKFTAFTLPSVPVGGSAPQLRCADFNGDGFRDVSVLTLGLGLHILINDRSGSYTSGPQVPVSLALDHRVADIDGDGDTDIVLTDTASLTRSIRLFLNDGRGNFTEANANQMPSIPGGLYLRLADLDGDGDLDIATSAPQLTLLENRGGSFVNASARVLRRAAGMAFEVYDVDRDGRMDLVAYDVNGIEILLQDAAGNFGAIWRSIPLVEAVMTLALADVDNDGDTDIFAGAGFGKDRYFEANGLSWTEASALRMPPVARGLSMRDARFVDIDEDGDLDLVIPKTSLNTAVQDRTRIYANDGAGKFSDITTSVLAAHADLVGDVTVDDVDGDGDTDIMYVVYALTNTSVVLEVNGMRRCAAPASTKIGTQLDVDFYAREGFAARDLSIPLLATTVATRAISVLDYGSLGLDLGTLLVLPAVAHSVSTGKATLSLQVPNNVALSGLQVWSQGLTFQSSRLRFSNVQRTTITR